MGSNPKHPIPEHPVQPLIQDRDGIIRFKENSIVRFLLDFGPWDLNKLAKVPFPVEDMEQFYQLIGRSLDAFGELDFVTDKTYNRACAETKEEESKESENQ